MSRKQGSSGSPAFDVVVHQSLALVRTPEAAQLEQLLARTEIRNRLVRRLDERTILISASGLAALRKRLAALGLSETLVSPEHGRG